MPQLAINVDHIATIRQARRVWSRFRNGGYDAFLVKLNPNLSMLKRSMYIGGSKDDQLHGMALGSRGEVFMVGKTYSSDFPTTTGSYDHDNSEGDDGFVLKLGFGDNVLIPIYNLLLLR